MSLLSVGEAAHYREKTGRLYLYCDSGRYGEADEKCLMPATEEVEFENEDGSWSTQWLCTSHAARFRKLVERDQRREAARLPRAPGGRLKRQGKAVTMWANLNKVREDFTEP